MADVQRVIDLVDYSTFRDDGQPGVTGRRITGVRVVLEHCARAILTPRGSLSWARDAGFDIRQLENADLTATQRNAVKALLDAEIRGVDFVAGVVSRLSFDPTTFAAVYRPVVSVASVGAFPLAVSVDKAAGVLVDFGGIS